jgi:hypothetical protein
MLISLVGRGGSTDDLRERGLFAALKRTSDENIESKKTK